MCHVSLSSSSLWLFSHPFPCSLCSQCSVSRVPVLLWFFPPSTHTSRVSLISPALFPLFFPVCQLLPCSLVPSTHSPHLFFPPSLHLHLISSCLSPATSSVFVGCCFCPCVSMCSLCCCFIPLGFCWSVLSFLFPSVVFSMDFHLGVFFELLFGFWTENFGLQAYKTQNHLKMTGDVNKLPVISCKYIGVILDIKTISFLDIRVSLQSVCKGYSQPLKQLRGTFIVSILAAPVDKNRVRTATFVLGSCSDYNVKGNIEHIIWRWCNKVDLTSHPQPVRPLNSSSARCYEKSHNPTQWQSLSKAIITI